MLNINQLPVIDSYNPATGDYLGAVPMSTETDVVQARADMAEAQLLWSAKSLQKRLQILKKFQHTLIDNIDEITSVINKDTGKSRQDALIEVYITLDMLQSAIKSAPTWLKRRRVSSGMYVTKRCYVEQRPFGVVAVISPWNFPLMLTLQPALTALIAGNTVLIKPSEVTAVTGRLIERLFNKVPDLAPYVRVLHGDGKIGTALVKAKPDLIYLTGSTETGKRIATAAAEQLIPTIFELGGKDPMIVLDDANIASAAKWGVWASCFNAGQACAGIERVYVVDSVYDAFVRLAVAEARKLKVGYSAEIKDPHHFGPLSSERQAAIVDDHLEDAIAKGAQVMVGGTRDGLLVQPTVLTDVDHTMKIMSQETFGPVMPIMRVRDEREAVHWANTSAYGLGASVWGGTDRAEKLLRQIQSGTLVANDAMAQFAVPHLPFGGLKKSGNGRSHGEQDLLQFTQSQAYMVSGPPMPFDVSVILRQPGNYRLGESLIKLLFGNPVQKLDPVKEIATNRRTKQAFSTLVGLATSGVERVRGLFFGRKSQSSHQQ